ncbi:hypothetical protein OROHE_002157 [Orobanche hederae]
MLKTCLTLAISRIKLLQNKRDVQLKLMRKEIVDFLQAGQEAIARIRVEHVIREQNTWEAYEILELFCELVLARLPILESQSCIIEKLSVSAPPPHLKLKVLKEIAREYNINWDSIATEAEFSKKPEDLLNGPKQIAVYTDANSTPKIPDVSSTTEYSSVSFNGEQVDRHLPSSASFVGPTSIEPSTEKRTVESITENKNVSLQPSDVLEMARNAIAAAERASTAARAASKLVNIGFKTFERKS